MFIIAIFIELIFIIAPRRPAIFQEVRHYTTIHKDSLELSNNFFQQLSAKKTTKKLITSISNQYQQFGTVFEIFESGILAKTMTIFFYLC